MRKYDEYVFGATKRGVDGHVSTTFSVMANGVVEAWSAAPEAAMKEGINFDTLQLLESRYDGAFDGVEYTVTLKYDDGGLHSVHEDRVIIHDYPCLWFHNSTEACRFISAIHEDSAEFWVTLKTTGEEGNW